MKCAIYARVSTLDQHCEMQLTDLRGFMERSQWESIEYTEHASGKAGSKRPALERLMADARLRKFDAVIVWKLDRFGRSLHEIIQRIQTLSALGIRFIAPSQNIDTDKNSPMGQFLIHILGAFAQLERDLIRERSGAGLKEYRRAFAAGEIGKARQSRSGKNLRVGRPHKVFRRDEAIKLRKQDMSWRKIAAALGVSQTTIRAAVQSKKGESNVR